MKLQLKLHSPAGTEPMIIDWPLIITKHRNQAQEVIDTITFVCDDFMELRPAMNNNIAQFYKPESYESMSTMCEKYNRAIDGIRQLWKGRQPPKCLGARPSSRLLEHIMHIVYNIAIPNPEKLNNYEPFSPEVYGETSFSLMTQILKILNPTPNDIFIDLGSGVGQAVLQAAASTNCKECWGIEKADIPAKFAEKIDINFKKWMRWFGKTFCKYQLVKGDFLAPDYEKLIPKCTLIFVNNFAFGPAVDHQLKQIFVNLAEGAKIVSSREFMPLNFRISSRNLSDIGSMMRIEELASLRGGVSWTGKPVKYYLHTVDSTALTKYYDRGSDQTFENKDSESRSDNDLESTTLNTDNSEESTIFKGEKMNDGCNSPTKVNSTENKVKMPDKSLHRVTKINATGEDKMKLKKKRKLISRSSILEAQINIPAINGDSEHLNLSQKEIKPIKKKKNNHLLEKPSVTTDEVQRKKNNQQRRKTMKVKMTKKFEKFTKLSENASDTSAIMENKQLIYDPSDTQNYYAINLLSNVALAQHNQSSENARYSEKTETSPNNLQNEINNVNKHRYYALAGYNQLLTSVAQNLMTPEFERRLKSEQDSLLRKEADLVKYIEQLESGNRSLLNANIRLADEALKALGISNPDDIVSWYPHEMTSVSSQHSKQQDLICSLNDELKHLHHENLNKFNQIKMLLGSKIGDISSFKLDKIRPLLPVINDSSDSLYDPCKKGQDDATPASNLLDSNNFHNHTTADKILAQNHKITADQELRSNGYVENVSITEKVKITKLQQEPHTFNVNVNTDLSEYYDPLGDKVKAIIPEKHDITSVNNQDLKAQSRYIDHCYDVEITNGKGITETSDTIISNGITGLNYNGYSQYKSVHTPELVNQKAVISNHSTVENGLTAIQKYYIDSN